MSQQNKITLSNGQTLNYIQVNPESPQKQVLTFVHGNMSTLKWWDQTIQALKPTNRRIIALDLRGFGKSSYINRCYKFQDWSKDVVELLKILKVQKSVVIGWSFGGAIAQKIAQLAPEIVSKVVLTCSVTSEGVAQKREDGTIVKSLEDLAQLPRIAGMIQAINDHNVEMMNVIFNMVLFPKMEKTDQKRKQQLIQSTFFQRSFLDTRYSLCNPDLNPELIKCPVLFIHGTADKVLPLPPVMKASTQLGKLSLWEGHGHMIPIEDNERYVKQIKQFIF